MRLTGTEHPECTFCVERVLTFLHRTHVLLNALREYGLPGKQMDFLYAYRHFV